jgi:hypothetical protein
MHFRVFEVSDPLVAELACQIEAEISKVCFDLVKVDMPVKILTGKRWGDLKPLPTAARAQQSNSSTTVAHARWAHDDISTDQKDSLPAGPKSQRQLLNF